MALKQSLQQKLGLKINPLQIQLIKLLELPTYQLEQRIKEELESNPLLEEGQEEPESEYTVENEEEFEGGEDDEEGQEKNEDDFTLEDYMNDEDDIPDYKLSVSNASKDDEARDLIFSQGTTFRENLMSQLGMRNLSDLERKVAEYIIGNIDDDGYLRRNIGNIVDDLAFGAGIEISEQEVEKLLKIIQEFEPSGVGARDLRECLLLQVRHKLSENPANPVLQMAQAVLTDCFEEFSRKHYEKIARKLRISDTDLKIAIEEILKLNPKPGGTGGDSSFERNAEKVIPDFTLDLVDGELQLTLNSGNLPELRINKAYLNILDGYKNGQSAKDKKDVVSFVKYKLNSAKSFIDAVEQRNNTLMLTMTAIVQFQKPFFLTGDESLLKPMILRDIADITGLDVSTISRVSNSKYVQTWFGIYALKDFFTGSMQMDSGEEVSTGELKNALKDIIDAEDKRKPLTDDELVDLMNQKGYQIARRTIAKYRQMLDIPVARLRREI
ncbi:RNA polymerase factor sigma-54 [uncultured Odoribacter sp.]|uniref:RNA polymerase factor sigma-54 n=1 Tax=uncultured Odoribacter sp. TaxID=876416 RepID=UPI002635AA03|nr:RNA polymerase factor sigma-54 [uncultured Odoribacter sp.]